MPLANFGALISNLMSIMSYQPSFFSYLALTPSQMALKCRIVNTKLLFGFAIFLKQHPHTCWQVMCITTFLYENVTVSLNMCSVFRFVWRFPNVTFFALLPVLFFFLRFIALSKQNITLLCYKYLPVYKLAAVIRRYFRKFFSLHRFTRSWNDSLIRLA